MYRQLLTIASWCYLVGFLADSTRAADGGSPPAEPTAEQVKFFETSVRPVLATRCIKCHGSKSQESELRLDSRPAVLKGGESGPAVVPGNLEESLLVEAVRYESFEMPPDEQLPDEQIAAIARWVKMGAPWPSDVTLAAQRRTPVITDEDRAHWSFRPVADPPPPEVADAIWCRSEIDRFVLGRLEQEGLAPAREADPIQLVRRLYFDLVGLPPSPAEIDEYLADDSPDRYERLVDRLLEDPRYGEKWARHWLDIVRYAESDGWRQDGFRREAYKYRDWVIRSFNEDKPYDRFVAEQIAGDEIDPGNPDAITASAYFRHGIYEYNQRDVETQWDNILNEITDVTGDALLGLGMACARCHDHKFDPIPQEDYYRLRAFFEPLLWREDQPLADVKQRAAYAERLAAWEEATAEIREKLDAIERPVLLRAAGGQGFDKFAPHLQAMMLKRPENRTPREHQIATLALRQLSLDRAKLPDRLRDEQKAEWESLQAQWKHLEDLKPQPLPVRRFAVSDAGPVAPPTYIPGLEEQGSVEPGFLTVLGGPPARIEPPHEALQSTGRRTALAAWLANENNPLTTRVIVNRVWQYHFGKGLVTTPDDFGRLGEAPSHPGLLDWLARRFVEDAWSFKALHRRILGSATYRQTALRPPPKVAQQIDPENRLLWRMNLRRLEAEQIRDAMLAASGELDLRMGGASVAASSPRRSIYVKFIRNTPNAILGSFDMADGFRSTARRNVTTTPLQALLMTNGPFVNARARSMAVRLRRIAPDDDALVAAAYRLAYGREPSREEQREAVEMLRTQAQTIEPASEQSREELLVETMPQTGTQAVLLKPDSKQRYLEVPYTSKLPEADFTIEAVVLLESVYPDATVRTIAAQWDNNPQHPGWALGVTSAKSRYRPRNLIVQLVGKSASGKRMYEVVASNIHLELNRPYYVSVAVDIDDASPAGMRFAVDDLSVANEPLRIARVPHHVTSGYRGGNALTIGGRHRQQTHLWDGLIDEVRLVRRVLAEDELLIGGGQQAVEGTVGHWRFESNPGMLADSSGNHLGLRSAGSTVPAPSDPKTAALVDVCHALLNSNEFLYID